MSDSGKISWESAISVTLILTFAFTVSIPTLIPLIRELKSPYEDPRVVTSHYEVSGNTREELRRQLDALGPEDRNGRRRDAVTRWKIEWSWPYKKGAKPAFEKTRASLEVEVLLPRWKDRSAAPISLHEEWNSFIAAIKRHEAHHIRIALVNFERPAKAIIEAAVRGDLTEEQANMIGHQKLAEIRRLDIAYDNQTKNGQTEGVLFK